MKNAMTRAHEIRKEAAIKFNCEASEFHFCLCLEMAWAEIKGESKMVDLKKSVTAFDGKIQVGNKRFNKFVTVMAPLKCSDALEKDIIRVTDKPLTHPTLCGGFRIWGNLSIRDNAKFIETMIDLAGTDGIVR